MEKAIAKKLRIAITGPESTGKTSLAQALAQHFQTPWVPEFSRAYLDNLGRNYEYKDILEIAKGQWQSEKRTFAEVDTLLFIDTDFLVCKIWSEVAYQRCDPWIDKMLETHPYDLYLLCKPDIPWVYDPLREHPHQRAELFDLYEAECRNKGLNFRVVSGMDEQRFCKALQFVMELIDENSLSLKK